MRRPPPSAGGEGEVTLVLPPLFVASAVGLRRPPPSVGGGAEVTLVLPPSLAASAVAWVRRPQPSAGGGGEVVSISLKSIGLAVASPLAMGVSPTPGVEEVPVEVGTERRGVLKMLAVPSMALGAVAPVAACLLPRVAEGGEVVDLRGAGFRDMSSSTAAAGLVSRVHVGRKFTKYLAAAESEGRIDR